MHKKLPVTVLIAARNEAVNIRKCLDPLADFGRVVVLDSGSVDSTAETALELGAEVKDFDYQGGYPKKRQWALDNLDIQTPWTLLLDADEVATDDFLDELRAVISSAKADDGYLITKGFHFMGKRFRFGGFSHSAVLLFRTGCARFEHLLDEQSDALDMEVHERLIVDGTVGVMKTPLIHEDYKGLEAYVARHNKYSTWEAKIRFQQLHDKGWGKSSITPNLFGNAQERRRFLKSIAIRTPFEPWLWFLYHYVLRLGFLEGRPGLIASQIRGSYIAQARAKLYEQTLSVPQSMPFPQVASETATEEFIEPRRAA